MRSNVSSRFARSGLASLDDLESPEWQSAFQDLSDVENQVRSASVHPPEYQWPRNPLREQTRPWEYPYVYINLKHFFDKRPTSHPLLLDIGSGFTFFPYCLARLGYAVTAIDVDPVTGKIFEAAARKIRQDPGRVDFKLADIRSLPFSDNSVDGIYSISVLEHIPNLRGVLSDIHRVLRDDGVFFLTFDVDLEGNFEVGPSSWQILRGEIDDMFALLYPETTVHPRRLLSNQNQPFAPKTRRSTMFPRAAEILRTNKKLFLKFTRRDSNVPIHVSSFGVCLRKKTQ